MKDINIVGYITKYMTKDIDNRLWGKRRYLYSYNLIKPKEFYIDFDNIKDLSFYVNNFNDMELKFENKYIDYFNDNVLFLEYKILKENNYRS